MVPPVPTLERKYQGILPLAIEERILPSQYRMDEPARRRISRGSDPGSLLDRGAHLPAGACLLESGGPVTPIARWTILAASPLASFHSDGSTTTIEDARGRELWSGSADPLDVADSLSRLIRGTQPNWALPFSGGVVLSLSHELLHAYENLDGVSPLTGEPVVRGRLYGSALVHDRTTRETWVTESIKGAGNDLLDWIAAPPSETKRSTSPTGLGAPTLEHLPSWVTSSLSESDYLQAVTRIQDHIRRGDVYEVNLTQQLEFPAILRPRDLHLQLRAVSPAPFSAYLDLPGATIISSSPERFLSCHDGQLESRPIKGTRPRGTTVAQDKAFLRELVSSEKEQAENVMIADLVRNDLGRVSQPGSVHVPRLCRPERHPGVHHLVTTVRSELAPGKKPVDAIRAAFPPGSMTGAPKLRACEVISELETCPRGAYAGAVGYIAASGRVDLSVLIRAFVCSEGRTRLGVGGAITAGSSATDEYRESLAKARLPVFAARLLDPGVED